MLRCQTLRAPGSRLHSSTAARPLRVRPSHRRVLCTAVPEGGLPGGPGGKPKPSSSRQRASRSSSSSSGVGQSEQDALLEGGLPPAALAGAGPADEVPASSGSNGAAHASTGVAVAAANDAGSTASDSSEQASWESWQQYFYEMDDLVQEMESIHSDLEDAVDEEDYKAAAAFKAQLDQLASGDCVGAALQELEAAVAEERFKDAARLRDESGVGLLGWWVGHGDGDKAGHLLQVTQDFGRYVGHLYTPKDITELLPELQRSRIMSDPRLAQAAQSLLAAGGLGDSGAVIEEAGPLTPEDVGLPVMEVFLRPAPEGSGRRFEQQAVALYAPEAALADVAGQMEQEAMASSLAEYIATDAGSSVISVEKGESNGSAFIKIEISSSNSSRDPDSDPEGTREGVPWSSSSGEEAEDDDKDIRTIDDLAASVGVAQEEEAGAAAADSSAVGAADGAASAAAAASSSSSSGRDDVGEEEEEELRRWQEQAAGASSSSGSGDPSSSSSSGDGPDTVGGSSERSIREEVGALADALLEQSQQQQQQDGSDDEDEEEGEERPLHASAVGGFLQRAPAQISWEGRDRFTIVASEPPALAQQREQQQAAAALAAEPAVPPLQRPPVRIIYDGKEEMRQKKSGGQPGEEEGPAAAGGEQQQQQGAADASSSSGQSGPDGSLDVQISAEETDSEEISVLLSPSGGQQSGPSAASQGPADTADASSTSASASPPDPAASQRELLEALEREREALKQQREALAREREALQRQLEREQDAVAEDSAALEREIEAVREDLEAGRKPSPEAINEIARRAMGLAIAQGITSADEAGAALAQRFAAVEGRTSYQRLPLDHVKTDPFDGLYIGSFGPHGPELLHVTRQMEGGKEWAVATKLTGDPNVPAGCVSWKALIGRSNRLSVDAYPPEMAVTARYRGLGQVAQQGFTNAKWVEGELLLFASDSQFVRGAQLGFTFDVRANQRYLVVLHRVHLDELFPEVD